jgi:hypothetical protein
VLATITTTEVSTVRGEPRAGQVVHIARGEAAEYQPFSFQENMHSYVHLTTSFIPVINCSLPT